MSNLTNYHVCVHVINTICRPVIRIYVIKQHSAFHYFNNVIFILYNLYCYCVLNTYVLYLFHLYILRDYIAIIRPTHALYSILSHDPNLM
jgi:hypothetical protein